MLGASASPSCQVSSPLPPILPAAQALFDKVATYLEADDVDLIKTAYRFGERAHEGQFRKSGEPYITHPVAVASILADWFMDHQALIAALLHDVMEDTGVTKLEIADQFGKPVADLVDGLSKLERLEYQTKETAQAENFRKMVLAMAKDIRVIIVKLADRLHNMRTLDAMREDKRRRIAQETIDIYAPVANRIGLNKVYRELQDLCFKHLHPNRYQVLHKAIRAARGNRREVVSKILDAVKSTLATAGINAQVFGREKTLFGIYRKMHIPDDPGFYEKFYFTPGDLGFTPIETSVGKLGVLVCWDQWYPEAARLMALADVFDALMTRRVYKPPMTLDETTKIIMDGRGKHFDPAVVDAFVACRERFAEIAARYADPVTEHS